MKEKRKKAPKKPPPPPDPVPPPPPADPGGALLSTTATKVSASAGIVAAMVLATLVNVLVARHYHRWDVTRGGLYTLSEATLATLHELPEPVKIYVLLPGGESLTLSVQHLLDGYRAETSRLDVELLDPDRRPADFLALAERYGIGADKEGDHLVAAAAALVTRGDRREIVRLQDLVEVDADDDLRRRPRLEQAFTGALRAVTSGDHPRACFTAGHGENPSQPLREHLARNGYEVAGVEPLRTGDKSALDECKVLIVAGPTEHVPPEDVARYVAYLDHGGTALVALSPQIDSADRGLVDLGLGDLLAGFGLVLDRDFVFEEDARLRSPLGRGETFAPLPRPHPATQTLLRLAEKGVAPVLTVASSLTATGAGTAAVTPLLVTSDQAFGMADFAAWARTGTPPVAGPADKKGPLTVAFAAERPGPGGKHGGRLIAVGSAGVLEAANWQSDALRGTAVFIESAVAWLTARPPILDIPQKPEFTAGLRVSDEWLAGTFRYVVLYMPLASLLLGVAVYLRRRGEKRGDPGGARREPGAAPARDQPGHPRARRRGRRGGVDPRRRIGDHRGDDRPQAPPPPHLPRRRRDRGAAHLGGAHRPRLPGRGHRRRAAPLADRDRRRERARGRGRRRPAPRLAARGRRRSPRPPRRAHRAPGLRPRRAPRRDHRGHGRAALPRPPRRPGAHAAGGHLRRGRGPRRRGDHRSARRRALPRARRPPQARALHLGGERFSTRSRSTARAGRATWCARPGARRAARASASTGRRRRARCAPARTVSIASGRRSPG